MDRKNAKMFLEELTQLQEKYGISVEADYVEQLDYTYDEEPYVAGIETKLVLSDREGNTITIEDLMEGRGKCYYCGRYLEEEKDYCGPGCEAKDQAKKEI